MYMYILLAPDSYTVSTSLELVIRRRQPIDRRLCDRIKSLVLETMSATSRRHWAKGVK